MKKNMVNESRVEGYLYSYDLNAAVTGKESKTPNTEYIRGTINIATDDKMTTIVPVYFMFVTKNTKAGKVNSTYNILNDILNKRLKSVMDFGVEEASKLSINSNIGYLREFYDLRQNPPQLITEKGNVGGFIKVVSTLSEEEKVRNVFKTDMVITSVIRRESEDDDTPEKMTIKGVIFNFRNDILPVEYSVLNPAAMDYFEDLEISSKNPVFTKVWGHQISETVVTKKVEETAFGEEYVQESTRSHKDFVITGAIREPYAWDDESTITAEELKEKMAERETYLATVRSRQEDYQKNKDKNSVKAEATHKVEVEDGDFDF